MSYVTAGTENSADIRIYYEDHGSGQPVVLIHGYPLNGHSWERQQRVLLHLDLTGVVKDRYSHLQGFLDNLYNTDTWLTGFREDLRTIDVPVLVVHGTEDRILTYQATAARRPGLISDVKLVTVEGGPHNIAWTHPDEVNTALLEFLTR
jgi:pimeloyl-ACP methyl ester carboxylesterase